MCGIFARINPMGKPVDLGECRRATHLIAHRGPDAYGEWVSAGGDLFLGFRRLSILDLSAAANQPMGGSRGQLLVFNGEIYNYRELRPQLEARGYRFHTSSDTEVLLHALEEWGEEALDKLEGMFGFLFWDPRAGEALIARDFLGIKPVYLWRPREAGLCVASEMKAFYALSDFTPSVRASALPEYVRFRCLPGEGTLLKEVTQLSPGQWARYRPATDELKRQVYWKPAPTLGLEDAGPSPVKHLQEVFRATVEHHLVADVPVGAQFSGGVDSSLSLAVAYWDLGRPMQGFHCSVEGRKTNELRYARAVADSLAVQLHTINLDGARFFSPLLERLTWHMDEPLGHPNAVGVHLVSALARPLVTVLISGEGADEVFAGYPRYSALLRNEALRRRPVVGALAHHLPPLNVRYYRALRASAAWARCSTSEEIATRMQFVPPALLERLFGTPRVVQQSVADRQELLRRLDAPDALTRCQMFDLVTYLPPLLIRQDKMSMAASIENRVPFVTPRMVNLGLSLPQHWRATWRQQKVILKRLFAEYCSRALVYRKKAGFAIPLTSWLRAPAGQARVESLRQRGCCIYDYLDRLAVEGLLPDVGGGEARTELIWGLLSLEVWLKLFRAKDAARAQLASADAT
jgi:asparagine synthase (glutamine-hydrolysing)